MTMEMVPLSRLHPAPWNPRILRDTRFKTLCKSLQTDPDFFELRPILATADGTIYGGNMRYRAAAHLGWESVPAIIADIPEQLAKERALKDNNAWGEWNDQELSEILAELQIADSDLELLGFDDQRLQELIGEPSFVEGPDDFKDVDETLETAYECPKCGYEWSGRPKSEGP